MNIKQLLTLKNLYIQAREENPGFIGINFAVGEIQISGIKAMLEIAPVDEWTRTNIDDTTHIFYSIDKHGLTWTCCFRRDEGVAHLPATQPAPLWDEPTPEEVTEFWADENADERADLRREAHYGKQL